MSNINIDLRLRPTRFAFLVRPDDKDHIREIFRINTCLWGGEFNPIVPCIRRSTSWWGRAYSAQQIMDGYIDFFEPDFIVEAEKGLADRLGFHEEKVLQTKDILERDGNRNRKGYGLSIHDIYRYLYTKAFQFVRREEHYNIVHVVAKNSHFNNFVSCVFGDFPNQRGLGYFKRDYKKVFNPDHISLDSTKLSELYNSSYTTALDIGLTDVQVRYQDHDCATLFILDAYETRDLIDFWNLRAVFRDVLAVPIQWIKELSPCCKKHLLSGRQTRPGEQKYYPEIIFSRSVSQSDKERIDKNYLQVSADDTSSVLAPYPGMWQKPVPKVFSPQRPILAAERKRIEILVNEDEPEVRFDALYPNFAREDSSQAGWANVVQLKDYSFRGSIATVFPRNHRKDLAFPMLNLMVGHLFSTTEGLITFPQYLDSSERWQLVDGTTAISRWFDSKKIKAVPSDAGRSTRQIISTLEGLNNLDLLANPGIIELFNKLTGSSTTKSILYKAFKDKVAAANRGDYSGHHSFERLVGHKVVKLGKKLKCSLCGSWSWYGVNQLNYSLTCDLCLGQFSFPITNPEDRKYSTWAYRVVGPFALPEYAQGGYSASLAIRFFSEVIGERVGSKVTWSAGQELTFPSGETLEVDFLLWRQRYRGLRNLPVDIIFGEAKSFGKNAFKKYDVAKMKALAKAYPDSILVFATMKDALSSEEVDNLRILAKWGRLYDRKGKQFRAHIMILTGTEMFSRQRLRHSWQKKGGKHSKMVYQLYDAEDDLRLFADLTQQLYLGMPSYL